MRKMGNNVCMLTEEQAKDIDSCCEYAANSQIKDVVLLKNMSADINNSVTVIDAATKKEQQLRLAEILGESFHEIFNNSTGKRTSCKKCP